MSVTELSVPSHFVRDDVRKVWRVPYQECAVEAEAWATEHHLTPAHEDTQRTCLLLVDCQNTFCLPGFELFVAGRSGMGAIEDNVRLCEFIYRNLGILTELIPTLDTHFTIQIFHPLFWVDPDGGHPVGGQMIISLADIEAGKWRVNPEIAPIGDRQHVEELHSYARHYVRMLTDGGKYPLMIWPYHAMLGGIGHALVASVEEALFFHSVARRTQVRFEIKGTHVLTENYSVLRPEVLNDGMGAVLATENVVLIEHLLEFDRIIIAGQAKSHCVAWTVADLLQQIENRNPSLANRIYLLEDCTSPVVVPGVVDFTEPADAAFEYFAERGMHRVCSTDPIKEWPE